MVHKETSRGTIHPKKIRPRISPEPDLYGARCTSDRAAIKIYIVTTVAAVKPPANTAAGSEARAVSALARWT
jgi:hypothetical protein